MTTSKQYYKLEMLPTASSRKVEIFYFGKCREGLETAYSYCSNACAWRITSGGFTIESHNLALLDLQSLSVYA